MKHGLQNVWLIGHINWKDDYATIEIARTKTAAFRIAEQRLAYAAYDWEKNGKRVKEHFIKGESYHADAYQKYGDWEKYVTACMSKQWHTSDMCYIRSYVILKEGINIIEPDGHIIRLITPYSKLVAELQKRDKKWERKEKQIINSLLSLKK